MLARCGSRQRQPGAALAVLAELVHRAQQLGWPLMNANRWPLKNSSGQGWPSRFDELRLVIEQLQLRRAAGHVQER